MLVDVASLQPPTPMGAQKIHLVDNIGIFDVCKGDDNFFSRELRTLIGWSYPLVATLGTCTRDDTCKYMYASNIPILLTNA